MVKDRNYPLEYIFKPGACRPAPGFLKLFLCGWLYVYVCVCMCVCVRVCVSASRVLITSGMMWCDINPI